VVLSPGALRLRPSPSPPLRFFAFLLLPGGLRLDPSPILFVFSRGGATRPIPHPLCGFVGICGQATPGQNSEFQDTSLFKKLYPDPEILYSDWTWKGRGVACRRVATYHLVPRNQPLRPEMEFKPLEFEKCELLSNSYQQMPSQVQVTLTLKLNFGGRVWTSEASHSRMLEHPI
jgi:hypothetical protein